MSLPALQGSPGYLRLKDIAEKLRAGRSLKNPYELYTIQELKEKLDLAYDWINAHPDSLNLYEAKQKRDQIRDALTKKQDSETLKNVKESLL